MPARAVFVTVMWYASLTLAVRCWQGQKFLTAMHPAWHEFTKGHGNDPDKGGEPGALCKYGNPNVLTIDIGTSQLAQATSAHTTLVEIEKYNGAVEQVTAFNGPVEMVAQCEYVPASQVKS